MVKIGAVINKESGTLPPQEAEVRLEEIRSHLEPRVFQNCLSFVPGDQVGAEIRRQMDLGVDVLLVGGGDGTVSTAAGHLAGTDIILGVIGLGTRNHFARDLEIPLESSEAIFLIDHLQIQKIDLGDVNGHVFINNVTLGMYPRIIEKRDEVMEKRGWRKWRSHLSAAVHVLWWLPKMRLIVEGREFRSDYFTPVLFIGNNEYENNLFIEPRRTSLNHGKLWICMIRASGIRSLLRMVWQMFIGGIQNSGSIETHLDEEVTVTSDGRRIKAGIDGEYHTLDTPLRFRIRKNDLRVLVP